MKPFVILASVLVLGAAVSSSAAEEPARADVPARAGTPAVKAEADPLFAPRTASPYGTDSYSRLGLAGSPLPRSGGLPGGSLLDPDRLSLRHSLSFGYASSSGAGDRSSGLWLTEIGYRFSQPLFLSVDVGASTASGSGYEGNGQDVFLGGMSLQYRPSRHFQMSLSYRNVPSSAQPAYWMNRSPYGGFGSRGAWGSFPSGPDEEPETPESP